MPTAFLTFTASFSVSSSLKFLPTEIGHLFFFGSTRLPKPSKTHSVRISIEIVRQPADCKCFKIPVLESPSSESRSEARLLAVGQHAYHRDERVGKFRVIP